MSGTLRAPLTRELSQRLAAVARRGERRILLDLARLHDIDAAGVGELIRAFNGVNAAGGILQIANPNRHVGCLLGLAGVYTILTRGAQSQ